LPQFARRHLLVLQQRLQLRDPPQYPVQIVHNPVIPLLPRPIARHAPY